MRDWGVAWGGLVAGHDRTEMPIGKWEVQASLVVSAWKGRSLNPQARQERCSTWQGFSGAMPGIRQQAAIAAARNFGCLAAGGALERSNQQPRPQSDAGWC